MSPPTPPTPVYTMQQQQQQVPRSISPAPMRKPEISEKPAYLMQQQPNYQQPQRRISPVRSPSPAMNQAAQAQPQMQQRPAPNRWNTPVSQQQEETKPLTVFNNVAANRVNPSPVSTPTPPPLQNGMNGRAQSQTEVKKPSQVGTLYIPPVEAQDMYTNNNNNYNNNKAGQPTPNWMQTRHTPGQEVPEWAATTRDEMANGFPFAQKQQQSPLNTQHVYQEAVKQQQQQPPRVVYQQQQQPQPQQQQRQTVQYTQTRQEQTTTSQRERIIPIQLEQTPTPTKCPTSPGFGPQPYYTGQQQYSSVQSPGGTVYHNNSPGGWEELSK